MVNIKEITIRLYEPSDFREGLESSLPYCAHSWLDIEVDGEVQTNLQSVKITADALTPMQVLTDSCEWLVNIDITKTLRLSDA